MEGTSINVCYASVYAQGGNERPSRRHCWCAASSLVKIKAYAAGVPSEHHFSLMLHLLLLLLLLHQQPLLLQLLLVMMLLLRLIELIVS